MTLNDLRMTRVKFPSAPEQEANFRTLLQRTVPPKVRTMELDRLEAALAMGEARLKGRSLPLRNDPPRIVFTTTPAVLVFIDGPPAYRPVAGTSYARVANTHPVLLKDSAGTHYLRIFDGWMSAPAVTGPFGVARNPPVELDRAMNAAAMSGAVDLLAFADPKDPKSRPSLAKGPVPAILVTQEATELIVTQGEPNYAPVEGTQLLYVTNTTGHVFKYLGDQQFYVLVTGRWFRAASLAGPWTHVPGRDLPPDFAKIPDDSPKENVKASVPGTAQAQEAVIANSIPETAAIRRSDARLTTVRYDGAPQLKPIEGTPLHYVVNSPLPVIQVDPNSYYALQNGVWFTGPSVNGPWTVAVAVPSVIYSIPPTSPLHYVTYVYVYRATPSVVYVGYTPGYYSVYVSEDVVVYGTGYSYVSWDGTVWYGDAGDLRVRGQPLLHPVDRLGDGLRLRPGLRRRHRRLGLGVLPLVGPLSLGRGGRALWGGGLGPRRLGGHHRQRLSPLGGHHRGDPPLRGLQRLDREPVGGLGGDVLQLPHRDGGRRPAGRGRQRLLRGLRLWRPGGWP